MTMKLRNMCWLSKIQWYFENRKCLIQKVKKIYLFIDENFECFSKSQIEKELKEFKKILDDIKTELFVKRLGDGSDREFSIIEDIYERIMTSNELIKIPQFEGKLIMQNIDLIITDLNNLETRKYVLINLIIKIEG